MRKIVVALVMLVLLLSTVCGFAYADELDLSGYSDDQVIALLTQLQAEIVSRKLERTATLQTGTYIGGKDIPAGTYILASAGVEGDAGIVSLRSVNDPENDWPSKLYEFERAESNYTVFVTIDDGDTLIVPYPYTLTISSGVMFK